MQNASCTVIKLGFTDNDKWRRASRKTIGESLRPALTMTRGVRVMAEAGILAHR